jgi:hypothetical protein
MRAPRRKADPVGRRSKIVTKKASKHASEPIQSEPLDPVGVVVRELTRPDGTTMKVEVPIYPPFQLKKPAAKSARSRKTRRSW